MIDKNNPNTWGKLFDTVIDLLDQGKLVEGVDRFDMKPVIDDTACGTAACLFGSAAILAGITDHHQIRNLFWEWEADEMIGYMPEIQGLCHECYLDPDEVIERYREFCQ